MKTGHGFTKRPAGGLNLTGNAVDSAICNAHLNRQHGNAQWTINSSRGKAAHYLCSNHDADMQVIMCRTYAPLVRVKQLTSQHFAYQISCLQRKRLPFECGVKTRAFKKRRKKREGYQQSETNIQSGK